MYVVMAHLPSEAAWRGQAAGHGAGLSPCFACNCTMILLESARKQSDQTQPALYRSTHSLEDEFAP
jgi:cytosine/adenosine deaminase-related metal-dependent hydrolase